MLRAIASAFVLAILATTIADARPRNILANQAVITCDDKGCNDRVYSGGSGDHSNSRRALSGRSDGLGRPAGCPAAWCVCWGRIQAGIEDPKYNLALRWLDFRHVPQQVGAWAVMARRGGGHVGIVTGIDPNGNPVIRSGNHGHMVGEGVYPKGRILAYVMPR